MKVEQYQILDAMGISLWENRLSSLWVCTRPLIQARCLVLLSHPLEQSSKILKGMLSVLELGPEKLFVAWPNPRYLAQTGPMITSLQNWSPRTLLIMGHELGAQLKTYQAGFVQITYHPDELQRSPEKKPEAYTDLLKLKQYLSI